MVVTTVIIVLLAVALGVTVGYAMRLRQELREALGKIEDLKDLAERQRVEVFKAHDENVILERVNAKLHEMARSHEANLEMLLREMDKTA